MAGSQSLKEGERIFDRSGKIRSFQHIWGGAAVKKRGDLTDFFKSTPMKSRVTEYVFTLKEEFGSADKS